MKNLKRALSFALASVMLIGMMAVGASANKEFTDAEQIDHDNAVDTLVALNVISGKEDGSYFAPEDVVTRGEMAKMVTVALNGGKDPVLNTNPVATYTDIKGHWAEKYIEYCVALGIVAGRGDGTFDPYGTVTGVEAAKMMLVAQGWESKIFGFTGNAWAANVNIEANKIELYDELGDIEPSEGLTRDDAAQLIYNGILADTMVKSPSMEITGEDITWNYGQVSTSIFERNYGGSVWMGTFTGNTATGANSNDGYIEVNGSDEDDYEGVNGTNNKAADFPYDFDIKYIGEEVKVLYKDATSGKGGEPDGQDKIYGVFTTGGVQIVNTTVDKINNEYGKDNSGAVEIDDVEYEIATDNIGIAVNYNKATKISGYGDVEAKYAATGDTLKLVLNSDNEISAMYIVESTLTYIAAVSDTKVSVNGIGSITIEDHEVYEGAAKDDFVVLTTLYGDSDDYKLHIVEKAEVVSGTVEGYTVNADDADASTKVVLDGTTYKIYKEAAMNTANDGVGEFADDHIDEDFDLYLVNGYVGAAVQTSESASNYSVIIEKPANKAEVGNSFDPAQVKVLAADGTKTILSLNDDSVDVEKKEIKDTDALNVGDLITWTGTADDAAVKVVAKWDSTTEGVDLYKDSTKAYDGVTVANNAVLFAETSDKTVPTGNSFKAYTLRGLDDFGKDIATIGYERDGKIVAVVADMTKAPSGAVDTTVYGIVSANNGVVKYDGDYYTSYTVENDTETFTLKVDGAAIAKGDLVAFEPSTTGTYDADGVKKVSGTQIWVKEYNTADETLAFYEGGPKGTGTEKTLPVDEDADIVYVNLDDKCAGDDIGVNAYDETVTNAGHVMIVTEKQSGDDVVIAIIVETSGKVDIMGKEVKALTK